MQGEISKGPEFKDKVAPPEGGDLLDLLDMDGPPAGGSGGGTPSNASGAAPSAIPKVSLLTAQQPGQNKNTGLAVEGALVWKGPRESSLQLTFTNSCPHTMAGDKFAIQLNKNPLGFSPGKPLAEVMPAQLPGNGGRCEIQLPLVPGKPDLLLAEVPPNPNFVLQLQIAIKCQLDIFYFAQPFDARAILDTSDRSWVDKNLFMQQWQSLEQKAVQAIYLLDPSRPPLDQNDNLTKQLESSASFFFVAKNTANNCNNYYYYARYPKSANPGDYHFAMLECALQNNMMRLNARCTQDGMAHVLHTTLVNVLVMKKKQ